MLKKLSSYLIILCLITGIIISCADTDKIASISKEAAKDIKSELRPEKWAKKIEKPGLPNFHQVSATLFRGAQPTEEGIKELKNMGIKTIINLRSFHSDRDEIGNIEINYEHIYFKAWHVEDKEIIRFLKIVTNPERTPVFVHCQHGADRTGTMCAVYRIVVEGWSKEEAIKEMTEGGFGYHSIWKNLINFIKKLDIEMIKKQAEIKS